MKKSFAQFITDHNLQDRTYHASGDICRAPATAARIIVGDWMKTSRIITADSAEEALAIAEAFERETNFSRDIRARHWIVAQVKSGEIHYKDLD